MAKKWIGKAVKDPGRMKREAGKKPGEKLTSEDIATVKARAKRTKNKSLMAAANLAERFKGGEFGKGK